VADAGGGNDRGRALSGGSEPRDRGTSVQPLDLPAIRQWLAGLVPAGGAPARPKGRFHRKAGKSPQSLEGEVGVVADNLSGSLGRSSTEDVLRRLLALGVVQYVRRVGRVPIDARAEDVVVDVAAFGLWSVAQAPVLPSDWAEVLARLTSPRMANLVAWVREADATRHPDNFAVFYGILAGSPVSDGTRRLLEDLSDQKRGGAALAALALATGLPEPDARLRQKTAVVWIFTALVGGALGAEGGHLADGINQMAEGVWDRLSGDLGTHGHSGSHGGTLADELINDLFHHH
jgi:hypothetical protein